MNTFNWKEAADYINNTYFAGRYHVYLDQLVYNANGKIEFRVPRVLVKDPDVYGYVKRHLTTVHGQGGVELLELMARQRKTIWAIDDKRSVSVRYEPGKGTFISITDTGDTA